MTCHKPTSAWCHLSPFVIQGYPQPNVDAQKKGEPRLATPFQNKSLLDDYPLIKLVTKGKTEIAHNATPGQLMPLAYMSWHAVAAMRPPTVRLADHLRKSPLVLNASVMSKRSSTFSMSIGPDEFWRLSVLLMAVVYVDESRPYAYACKASFEGCTDDAIALV